MNKMLPVLILVLLFCTFWRNAEAQIAVIVNNDNTTTDLTLDHLKKLYSGRVTTFSDGKRVRLAEYAPLKKKFYKVVLKKSIHEVKKYWISFVLSGKSATPPIEIKDIDEVKSFVSKNHAAICFIDISAVDKNVKVLTIEGKKPTDAKYFLK